jgi:hypothetical protein
VLTLRPEMRIATVTAYMDTLDRKLSADRYRDSRPAVELRHQVREFTASALPEAGTGQ